MRPPFVKRQTTSRSGFFAVFFRLFFPGKVNVRARGLTAFPSTGAAEVCCTKHVLRFYRHCDGECRETLYRPLRPRNISVPSYRPTQQGGCTFAVRQFASGSGEGQHTSPLGDHRRMSRSRSGCPINRRELRGYGLGAPGRSLTQRDHHSEHSPQAHPMHVQLGVRLTHSAHYPWRNLSISKAFWRFNM